jgi:hypothetical protein
MIPKAMDSLDLLEVVMALEEVLGIELPSNDAEQFGTQREMVDWLESRLSNQRPTNKAAALLRGLAKSHNDPVLAEGLNGTWRREQIAAIIRELFQDRGKEGQ